MIICVVSHKGGSTKTTTTLNLGAAIAQAGQRVTLVDLDAGQHDLLSFKGSIPGAQWRQSLHRLPRIGHVLIDCPPRLEADTIAALRVADLAIVPVQPNRLSYQGAGRLIESVNTPLRTLLCLYSGAYKAERDDIRAAEGERLLGTIIPRSRAIEQAIDRMQTIYQYAPESPAANAYTKLAKEVLDVTS